MTGVQSHGMFCEVRGGLKRCVLNEVVTSFQPAPVCFRPHHFMIIICFEAVVYGGR